MESLDYLENKLKNLLTEKQFNLQRIEEIGKLKERNDEINAEVKEIMKKLMEDSYGR